MSTIDYGVSIELLDEIKYQGIFSIENNDINILTVIDKNNYEYMFLELINKIKYKIDVTVEDNEITIIECNKDIISMFEMIKSMGINITYELIPF